MKLTENDRRVMLYNNIMGYKVGDEHFLKIIELHSGYNRTYRMTDKNGTRMLTKELAMNEMAEFVDNVVLTGFMI